MGNLDRSTEEKAGEPGGDAFPGQPAAGAAATSPIPATPLHAVALIGYLREDRSDRYRRLYRDLSQREWITIAADDILDRFPVDGGTYAADGQSVIWVRREACIERCELLSASTFGQVPASDMTHEWPRA